MASNMRLTEGTFKKCDMHVHSSSCYSRSYGRDTFFATVLNSDLDVLAVTDHNIVDVDLLEDLHRQMAGKGKILIAGAEINVRLKEDTIKAYKLVPGNGRKGAYFHAIIWFDMTHVRQMGEILESLFIAKILDESDDASLTESKLRTMQRKVFSEHTRGQAIFLEDFQEKTASIPHFFIPHENKDKSLSHYLPNVSNGKLLPTNMDYKDKLFYYSHAMAVEGGDKSRRHISEGLAEELNTTVAALFFSDAQTELGIGSRFTWIDFDGDLDSLLLAVSDPESRIRTSDVQIGLPQTNTNTFLESVTFNTIVDGDRTHPKPQTINFSPGFNGVVGSRGSGKTLLASLLAGRGLDTYSNLVDIDSIKFTMHGGIQSANRPSCLFLGQGELESIFTTGDYEQIPFLGDHVKPLKDEAMRESKKAYSRLSEILKLEKELLETFYAKYQHGFLRIDYLDTELPSGITIATPTVPPSDSLQLDKADKEMAVLSETLDEAAIQAETVHFNNAFPENRALFTALEKEAMGIRTDIAQLSNRIKRLVSVIEKIEDPWIKCRDELLTLFVSTIRELNSESGSTMLYQYNEKALECATFFDDLLELRLSISYLDHEASAAYSKMLTPIEPIKLTNNGEEIVISLGYGDVVPYSSRFEELTASQQTMQAQPLVRALLYQFNQQKMHRLFNGTKIRSASNSGLVNHYKKFFELLLASIQNAGSLETNIVIGGKRIADMSPGMKAQALLKLFLNDTVSKGQWTYIVLDQPEDNLDVATIKDFLIDRLKKLKLNVQFFVVSHSAPIIVNGDARTVIVCVNDNESISYSFGALNEREVKQSIADVLDGGERYLKMRLNKYNFQIGDAR